MSPFLRIPVEIIQEIIRHVDDFAGLDNLISVLPQYKAIFLANSHNLVPHMLPLSTAYADEIKTMASRIIIPPSSTLNHPMPDNLKYYSSGLDSLAIEERLRDPEFAYQFIRIGAQIQRLTCLCLSRFRNNLVAIVGTHDTKKVPRALRSENARRKFSWIEEYRVYWALWHLQLYGQLRRTKGICPKSLEKELWNYCAHNDIDLFMAEQIWTVASELVSIGFGFEWFCDLSTQNEIQSKWLSEPAWDFPANSSIPHITSFDFPLSAETEQQPLWSLFEGPAPQRNGKCELIEGRAVGRSKLLAPMQMKNYRSESREYLDGGSRGLLLARLNNVYPYRRIGLFLWDNARMASIGFEDENTRGKKLPMFRELDEKLHELGKKEVFPYILEIISRQQRCLLMYDFVEVK